MLYTMVLLFVFTIFRFRMHPKTIFEFMKNYLKKTNRTLNNWDASINLANLYIEFSQPSSKFLDWLYEHQVEYLEDADMLCVFKPKSKNENIYFEDRQKINPCTTIDSNNNNDNNNNIINNKTNINDICTCDIKNNNVEDEVINTVELKSLNKKILLHIILIIIK